MKEEKAVAYLRVSTDRQDVENQKLEVLKLANEKNLGQVSFLEETVSGKKGWRSRELGEMFDTLEPGDYLIVSELSRLGRSMLEIMEILTLAMERRIKVYAAKGGWALEDTIQSKIVAMVLAMAAEIERDLISQRTKAALRVKKEEGVKLGRRPGPGKSKLDVFKDEIRGFLAIGVPKKRIAEKYNTSVRNLRHWMTQRGILSDGTLAKAQA